MDLPYIIDKGKYRLVYNEDRYSVNYRYMIHIYRMRDNGRTCKYCKALKYDLSLNGIEQVFDDFLKGML